MSRRFVQLMTDGDTIEEIYLISDKQLRANRNGNLYLQVELRDRTGAISARLWNASEHLFRSFETGDFLQVKGKVQLFQGALQIILSHIDRVETEKVELADFLPHTEHDVNKLLDRLRSVLLRLGNPHLRALAECFLMMKNFCRRFAKRLDAAERILPLYPELDRDLLLAGVFLHDIGKIRELSYGKAFAYTDEGQLVGHLVIGVEMLDEKAAKVPDLTGEPFPKELLLRLRHMILSHHGTYEFGSPRLPMTPEAIALHHLDNLDAKIHNFTREIREDRNTTSTWTPFNQSLQRRLFKGATNGEEAIYSPTLEALD